MDSISLQLSKIFLSICGRFHSWTVSMFLQNSSFPIPFLGSLEFSKSAGYEWHYCHLHWFFSSGVYPFLQRNWGYTPCEFSTRNLSDCKFAQVLSNKAFSIIKCIRFIVLLFTTFQPIHLWAFFTYFMLNSGTLSKLRTEPFI